MIKQLLVIGDVTIDTHIMIDDASLECNFDRSNCKLCLDYAAKIPVKESFQTIGGNGVNVAIGAAKLDISTAILSSVGNDNGSEIVKKELKDNNVETDLITVDTKTPTRYSTILNFKGERTILAYHHKRQYVWPKNEPEVDWVYFTGLSDGFENILEPLNKYLIKHPTVRLAYNPGSFQLKNSLDSVQEMLGITDLLIVNRQEAEKILGTTMKKEKSIEALIHELINLGAQEVAITDAANGAMAGNEEYVYEMESYPVQVIAKTGAGDAFSSGYLAAKINNHDIPTCLVWGIANSCAVIQKPSSHLGLLRPMSMKKMINTFLNIRPKKIF
jgi:sugar/nucleoside kinase (ribokinase family)